ncbi:hypothetical protein M5C99_21325 [Acidovorax sp. NCPPB 2350]|nr:hypothetical protein M5C99_21325 [Acidovorax sp. NCPPB 2350]
MAQAIAESWRGLADSVGMTRKERDVFEDAFVHPEAKAALSMARAPATRVLSRP